MPSALIGYPGQEASVNNTLITLEMAMDQPERMTRDIVKLTDQGLFLPDIFSSGGGVNGGALIYETPNPIATDLYPTRDVKEIAPGQEIPILTFDRGIPMVAKPRKIGGRLFITKEAKKRNDPQQLARAMVQMANTIRLRLELLGFAELNAVIAAQSRFTTGTSWSTYAATALNARSGTSGPVADVAAACMQFETEMRGQKPNALILNNAQALSVAQAFPGVPLLQVFQGPLPQITSVQVTPRQTAGRFFLYQKGQVGVWKNEFGLDGNAWTDNATEVFWYSSTISPLFAVTNQFAFLEGRGVA